MRKRQGLTLVELLIVIAAIIVLLVLFAPHGGRSREEARRIRCRNILSQLSRGMATYLTELGDGRFYPCPLERGETVGTYNGAEWLAALYWTRVVPDPGMFLCPASPDTNSNGKDIGCKRANDAGGRFSSQTVSYAGMWWKSVATVNGGAIPARFPENEPMACDDTQGGINHGEATNGGMCILFFDSHVEFKTNTELDITSRTGSIGKGFPNPPKTLLWRLRN